ncbi:hypothetical protein Fsol_00672 [Candidatus Fokinia solitaria]|uniref:Lipoprotein n=1 Tax=Candidatus Fokinia solitaria TaxID=1802984 RepID=A0A2U8BT48_9RICK|nr:hypothetical protein [Candidatus Fokinia solitaria]AWD33450.1 hypothetical protein Fsol_00672 [Candidatus Fokinia solitaria]
MLLRFSMLLLSWIFLVACSSDRSYQDKAYLQKKRAVLYNDFAATGGFKKAKQVTVSHAVQ